MEKVELSLDAKGRNGWFKARCAEVWTRTRTDGVRVRLDVCSSRGSPIEVDMTPLQAAALGIALIGVASEHGHFGTYYRAQTVDERE